MSGLMEKAREAAADAQALFESGRYNSACNRAYYAMFNAAPALLELRGHDPEAVKTHASVLRLFSLEYLRSEVLDPEFGPALRSAARARHIADYEKDGVSSRDAELVIALLAQFLEAVERTMAQAEGQTL